MAVNLLSLGWLYKRGYILKESNHGNFIIYKETGTRMFKVYIEGGVFKVRTPVIKNQVYATSTTTAGRRSSADKTEENNANGIRLEAVVQVGTLWHFHKRFGHLNYDKIIKMAKKPESGIKLLDQERKYCVTCAEGKQTKNSLQKRDKGANSPIDQPGGVICSDIKGPMSPPIALTIGIWWLSWITTQIIQECSWQNKRTSLLTNFNILWRTSNVHSTAGFKC
jgi:hypothetical protein